MASLADIPDAFFLDGMLDPFLEWLILLPATIEAKTELLSEYSEMNAVTCTNEQFQRVMTEGFILRGN